MNGVSRTPRVPVPPASLEGGDGYAWSYYGRDTLPDDLDPCPVRPRPRCMPARDVDGTAR
ncbi:MAG: hypothetical protein IT178_14535 [Acidobacteria bacterium]|nr:hypothetical protein [Acidobacteriota bacterium]